MDHCDGIPDLYFGVNPMRLLFGEQFLHTHYVDVLVALGGCDVVTIGG